MMNIYKSIGNIQSNKHESTEKRLCRWGNSTGQSIHMKVFNLIYNHRITNLNHNEKPFYTLEWKILRSLTISNVEKDAEHQRLS